MIIVIICTYKDSDDYCNSSGLCPGIGMGLTYCNLVEGVTKQTNDRKKTYFVFHLVVIVLL